MSFAPRLRALEDRHAALDAKLVAEAARPKPDAAKLAQLKQEKLRLKEEITRLRPATSGQDASPG